MFVQDATAGIDALAFLEQSHDAAGGDNAPATTICEEFQPAQTRGNAFAFVVCQPGGTVKFCSVLRVPEETPVQFDFLVDGVLRWRDRPNPVSIEEGIATYDCRISFVWARVNGGLKRGTMSPRSLNDPGAPSTADGAASNQFAAVGSLVLRVSSMNASHGGAFNPSMTFLEDGRPSIRLKRVMHGTEHPPDLYTRVGQHVDLSARECQDAIDIMGSQTPCKLIANLALLLRTGPTLHDVALHAPAVRLPPFSQLFGRSSPDNAIYRPGSPERQRAHDNEGALRRNAEEAAADAPAAKRPRVADLGVSDSEYERRLTAVEHSARPHSWYDEYQRRRQAAADAIAQGEEILTTLRARYQQQLQELQTSARAIELVEQSVRQRRAAHNAPAGGWIRVSGFQRPPPENPPEN